MVVLNCLRCGAVGVVVEWLRLCEMWFVVLEAYGEEQDWLVVLGLLHCS